MQDQGERPIARALWLTPFAQMLRTSQTCKRACGITLSQGSAYDARVEEEMRGWATLTDDPAATSTSQ